MKLPITLILIGLAMGLAGRTMVLGGRTSPQDDKDRERKVGRPLIEMRSRGPVPFTNTSPPPKFDLEAWAKQADQVLSGRFEVPSVNVEIVDRTPKVQVLSCDSIGLYDRGRDLIRIYLRLSDGTEIPEAWQRYQFFHAWIHHLEKWRAVPRASPGHEGEFDRIMKILGLIR